MKGAKLQKNLLIEFKFLLYKSKHDKKSFCMKFKAVIIGGSGAVGSNVLNALFQSESCQSVISLGRKEIDTSKFTGNFSKCKQSIVNFDNLAANQDLFQGIEKEALKPLPTQQIQILKYTISKQKEFYKIGLLT